PADPVRKMSKSLGEKHYINVFGEPDKIRKQVRSAVTDTGDTPEGQMSAGVANLFELLKAAGEIAAHESLLADYKNGVLKYVALKDAVGEALGAMSEKFRTNKTALLADKKLVKEQIKDSSAVIRKRAQETMRDVKELSGLLNVKF
ncbi:MAG TPA: tryptophan--tRNA ligase, partial [Saprospiraceae bacterium]|nr:tryptophan--tRNA ligase [Saprospiraceae bacterium]